MKKFVTLGNVLGLIGAIVALIVLCLCGHWVLGIFATICILGAVWLPGNVVTSWIKAACAAAATFLATFAITHTGIIFDALTKTFQIGTWLIPLLLGLIAAIVGCVFAWNNRSYYRHNGWDPFARGDDEEDTEGEGEGMSYAKIIDLTLIFSKEAKTIHVWANEDTHTALIIFGDNRWALDREVDKLVEHTAKKTSVMLSDGTLLCIPSCKKLQEALA